MLRYIMIGLTTIVLYSCEGDTQDQSSTPIVFQKSQGQCGETWGDNFLDYQPGDAREAAAGHLTQLGIPSQSLRMDSLHQLYICATCHDCPSGWYYILEAIESHEDTLIKLGFERQ